MNRLLLSAAIIMLLSPAYAIDFTQTLTNLDGTPVVAQEGKPQPTLGTICEQALLATFADERDSTGKETIEAKEKFDRWKLASKLNGTDVKLSAEELALVKKLVGKAYSPLIVGQAWSMLDPGVK